LSARRRPCGAHRSGLRARSQPLRSYGALPLRAPTSDHRLVWVDVTVRG